MFSWYQNGENSDPAPSLPIFYMGKKGFVGGVGGIALFSE